MAVAYDLTGSTGGPYNMIGNSVGAATQYLFVKNAADAWTFNIGTATVAAVSDADYPASTVPGVVFHNGYIYVMTPNGVLHNCDLEDPTAWAATSIITAEVEPDQGVALGKHQNYPVAFGEWTTEVFYGNPDPPAVGSPLLRAEQGFSQVGCAQGYSVASVSGILMWIGKTREKGRSVYRMNGFVPEPVSTPDIDRILNADALTTVHAYGIKLMGHSLYVLTLDVSAITLVYDLTSNAWYQWTGRTTGSPVTITSLTQSGGIATATKTGHGFSDGDPVTHAGANQAGYNITANITRVDANSYTYPVAAGTVSPATGTVTATGTTESHFPYIAYVHCSGKDLLLHESDGWVYEALSTLYQDNGVHIDVRIRTPLFDAGDKAEKTFGDLMVVGDQAATTVLVRHTNDDYQTYTKYRPVDMSLNEPRLRRNGAAKRRAWELRHTGNTALRLQALDTDVERGA